MLNESLNLNRIHICKTIFGTSFGGFTETDFGDDAYHCANNYCLLTALVLAAVLITPVLAKLVMTTHSTKKPVTTMLTYPWKCTVLHCNHLGNTWKPLVLMTRHFDYCPSTSEC